MENNALTRGLASQLIAGLAMLKDCIDRCPEEEWNELHNDYPFSQVVFHTLFDCDYKLCENEAELKEQTFHRKHREDFADYEDLEDRTPRNVYRREFINRYYEHCRERVAAVIETRSNADLVVPNGDVFRNMTKLERYANIVRHVQHHTAQLGFRLQLLTEKEMDWISRGYGD
jgi:hypothetical protein